jgi:hypothetical protein
MVAFRLACERHVPLAGNGLLASNVKLGVAIVQAGKMYRVNLASER